MGVFAAGQELTASRLNAGTTVGETVIKVFATSGTMTSSTYVDLPSGTSSSLSFTKYRTASAILVHMKILAFSATNGSTGLRLGVRINSTDYDVALGYYTTANAYAPASGVALVASGLTAGTYTVQARWKRSSGTGTITTADTISELDMSVREVGI